MVLLADILEIGVDISSFDNGISSWRNKQKVLVLTAKMILLAFSILLKFAEAAVQKSFFDSRELFWILRIQWDMILEKNGFVVMEEFEEDGILSKYLQLEC